MNNLGILNRISKLAFCGFYDVSKNVVTVHFFNEKENKPDIMAYLNIDMTWDVREVISETALLYCDCEIITIKHKALDKQLPNSAFDNFVRSGLKKMAQEALGKDVDLNKTDKMFEVFEKNSY